MPARRFFVEGVRAAGDVVEISGADAHKIAHVLRLRDGAHVELIDSAATLFDAIVAVDGERVRATLLAAGAPSPDAAHRIDLAQALPKGQKMDFVVEKATELGAEAILPFSCERTVIRFAGLGKLERWRRLATAASQQSGRRTITRVEEPLRFDALLERFGEYDAVLFPWELAAPVPLRERLPVLLARGPRLLVVVGPEGGFSHDEAQAARARGAELLWLGPRILRTETAALALLSAISLW
jgi:16S rRNA (uracil1498-N3)-methyltransferase